MLPRVSIATAGTVALYLPVLALLALYDWAFLHHAWSVVTYPYQIDYGEMPELNRATLLARGEPIYVDWSTPPYQMANYTPLYPALASLGVMVAGPQFFTGRLLSLAATLLTAVSIGVSAAVLGRRALPGWIAGSTYLIAHPVWNWGALQRVDALAVAFEWLGIAVFLAAWPPRGRAVALWWTVPLFLAAVYTRQTVVAGAFACYACLLVRRPRLGLQVAGAYAGAGLAILGILQLWTGGQFWIHTVGGNLNRWHWDIVLNYWRPFWRLLHWTFPLALVAVTAMAWRRQLQVPLLYLAASAATALTIGKVGSNVNYLLQVWAALALAAGLSVAAVSEAAHRRWRGRGWTFVLHLAPALWLLVGLQQAHHLPHARDRDGPLRTVPSVALSAVRWTRWPLYRLDPWSAPPAELATAYRAHYLPNMSEGERLAAAQAHEYVAALEGDVLGEDMAFTVTTGKRLYVQPFEFSQLADQGAWDQRPLLDDVRRKRFSAVVVRFPLRNDPGWHGERINRPLLEALRASYRQDAAFGDYYFYVPY